MTDYAQIRKQLRNNASNNNGSNNINNSNNNYDDDALEQLRQDMRDLHTAMRKQKGEWVRQLNDALGKIDQQGKVIAAQQVEIDALKRQLSSSSGNNNNNNNSNNSNSNNYLSHNSKSLLDSSSTSLGRSNNTNSKKLSKSNKTTTTTTTTTADNEGSESSCELPGLLDGFLTKNSKPKTSTNGNNSGSDFISMAGESFMQDSFRPMEDDCLDEGDGDVELEFDFSVLNNDDNNNNNNNEQPQDNDNTAATTPFAKGKCNRRGSLDSVQTIDLEEPRKKTISLLPHKSVQIYNEQRADAALRKLMRRASGNNTLTQHISVRKVHKKNLVFYQDRIYIPAGLTTKTMEFYFKKYRKQTPILHLEKNCYWPTMREDMKKYENKAQGMNWKVRIS